MHINSEPGPVVVIVCTLESDHGLGSESAPSQRVSTCAPACTASESAGTPAEMSSRATESSTVSCCGGAGGAGSQYTLLSPTLPTAISTVPVAVGTTTAAV